MTRPNNLRTARTFVYILLALTTIAAVAYCIFTAISLSNDPSSSMPWWTSLHFTALYFLPFIVPEIACCVIFSIFYNKRVNAEKKAQIQ